ncbi:hypothetical protein F4805DRAFT_264884 [Annulohypoxylon moriforme]|nr:hypothetical protein F4805DRAFT_264884 [Annulohypoxylon moriforme]
MLEQLDSQKLMPDSAGSSPQHIPRLKSSQQSSPTRSKLQPASSSSSLRYPQQVSGGSNQKSDHAVEPSPPEKRKLSSISRIPVRREQPSVADLRKSFENGLEPPKAPPQTPSKRKPPAEKTPDRTTQSRKEISQPAGLIRRSTPSVGTITSTQAPPSIAGRTAQTDSKNEHLEQSSLVRNSIDTVRRAPRVSLPKSSRFRQRDAHNLDGAASFEQDDDTESDEACLTDASHFPETRDGKDSPFLDLIHPFLSTSSISNFHNEMGGNRPLVRAETIPKHVDRVAQKPISKPRVATRCAGKVSDLRRLFERTPTRDTSPNPFKSFWQNRSRNKPKVEGETPIIKYDQAGSPIMPAADNPPPKKISLPELTTAISINDFSCDFRTPEALGNASSTKHKARFDIEPDENISTEQDSPVKGRIQQFERLERSSPAPSPTWAESCDANVNSSPRGKENDSRHVKTQGSWRPFRQRSVELWRRISSSFVRSAGEEQAGPSSDASNLDSTAASPLCRRLRYRRSDIFSYYLYRSSEVARSPTISSRGKSSASIDDDLVATIENQLPHITCKKSSCRDISMSKTFPFLARMSDSLGGTDEFDDFGFDGSILSKATRYRAKSPTKELPQSSSSHTPHGDPNTLSKVLSQQTVAERKRRRLEEKQFRREQRDKKREERAKAKGKEKAAGDVHSDNDGKEATAAQDKGKGKQVEGKKRESSWTKKTASGFVVRQINDVKLRHPKPRRPGQVKKLVNMYKEKASSGIKLGKGSGASSGSGTGATGPANH